MIDEVRQGSERIREHIQSILSWSVWSVPSRKFRTAVNTSQPQSQFSISIPISIP